MEASLLRLHVVNRKVKSPSPLSPSDKSEISRIASSVSFELINQDIPLIHVTHVHDSKALHLNPRICYNICVKSSHTALILSHNKVPIESLSEAIVVATCYYPSITTLDLSHSFIFDNPTFSRALRLLTSLTHLNLSHNELFSTKICNVLRSLPLISLDLSHNAFKDAHGFVPLIRESTTLKSLD